MDRPSEGCPSGFRARIRPDPVPLRAAPLRYKRAVQLRYTTFPACFESLFAVLRSRVGHGMAICEIGAGANPLLSRDERDRLGLTYTLLDIDPDELAKAPDDLDKIVLDITSGPLPHEFDIVVSKHFAEHVRDPEPMHQNIRAMLKPGGVAIHFFPTLYSAPFVLNRLIPEKLAERILLRLQPSRAKGGNEGKFPAYYRWCRGPTRHQIRCLLNTGLEVDQYIASFGHAYYARASVLQRLEDAKTRFLLRHPVALLTSYSVVVLRRPN